MKKVFFASISLLILVLIFLGAYNFAFRNNVNDPTADPDQKGELEKMNEQGVLPQTSIENPINENVLGVAVSEKGELFYYSFDDRSLKRSSLEGKNKTILLSNLPGVPSSVLWSPKRDQALLFLKEMSGGNNLWYFADIERKTITPLKKEVSRPTWNNLGDKIFYQYTDATSGNRTLNRSNPDGSDWRKVADLGKDDHFISAVPQSSLVSFWTRPSATASSVFETSSSLGENRRVVTKERFGADYSWAPNGESVLVSTTDRNKDSVPALFLLDAVSGKMQNLSIPTIVSKTVWAKDSKTVYYALPGALPEGAVFPNDYFQKPLHTKDTFWKMDIETGKKTRLIDLAEANQSLDSTNLFLSPREDFFYFTDRVTERLYKIEL